MAGAEANPVPGPNFGNFDITEWFEEFRKKHEPALMEVVTRAWEAAEKLNALITADMEEIEDDEPIADALIMADMEEIEDDEPIADALIMADMEEIEDDEPMAYTA